MTELANDWLYFWGMMTVAIAILIVMAIEAMIVASIRRIRKRNHRRWIQLDWDHPHDEFINLRKKTLITENDNDKNQA